MEGALFQIIAATVAVSLISLVGIVVFGLGKRRADAILFYAVSFSAGTMLGAAFFDLLPESAEMLGAHPALEIVLGGILFAFVIEKIVHWHHHHAASQAEHIHPMGALALFGDALHNFFDGVAIAAAFVLDPALGITTTLAIAMHEIPQEIGDFGLLLYSGFSRSKALLFNLLSALFALAGGLIFYYFSGFSDWIEGYAIAFSGGMFIYIAAVDLLPEIHKEKTVKKSALQLAAILCGVLAIWLVSRVVGHGA
ncbi:MAG: ZIP family metal transporter [Candidatus Micrarchaeota archaeon]|nr:ZIP family metal transporter [Candidatus Micrarchaeota archaeon]